MLSRDTIRADRSSKAISWNNEYKQLDQRAKDLLIEYRQNREQLSNADDARTPELEKEAGLLRNGLLQYMTDESIYHLHNCEDLIDDVERFEYDIVELPQSGTIPASASMEVAQSGMQI